MLPIESRRPSRPQRSGKPAGREGNHDMSWTIASGVILLAGAFCGFTIWHSSRCITTRESTVFSATWSKTAIYIRTVELSRADALLLIAAPARLSTVSLRTIRPEHRRYPHVRLSRRGYHLLVLCLRRPQGQSERSAASAFSPVSPGASTMSPLLYTRIPLRFLHVGLVVANDLKYRRRARTSRRDIRHRRA